MRNGPNLLCRGTRKGFPPRTGGLGDCEVFEAVAALQRDPAEALDLEGLDAGRGEPERAVPRADEVEAAALEQGERDGRLASALAAQQREVGEVGAGGEDAVDRGLPEHGADHLQHAEPLHPAPRGRGRHDEPPEPELLEARGDADAVQVVALARPRPRLVGGGGVDPQLEDAQRGGPRREPAREQRRGEGAVDDELLEARGGGDHPADGVVGRRGGLEGAPREVERREVGHAAAPAAGDGGAGRHVAGAAELREDVLHDAVRERVHPAANLHALARGGSLQPAGGRPGWGLVGGSGRDSCEAGNGGEGSKFKGGRRGRRRGRAAWEDFGFRNPAVRKGFGGDLVACACSGGRSNFETFNGIAI